MSLGQQQVVVSGQDIYDVQSGIGTLTRLFVAVLKS